MQNNVLQKFHIYVDTLSPLFVELDPNFDFEILAKKDEIGTIPQPSVDVTFELRRKHRYSSLRNTTKTR